MLIRDVGFDPVDAGALRVACYLEPSALLMGELAYEGEGGPEVAYRFEKIRAMMANLPQSCPRRRQRFSS